MRTIRIAPNDWLETEFSVPVVRVMHQGGRERRLITDGESVKNPFAGENISRTRAGTNTVLIVPAA